MQCFRLMNMPDRVIAFDELPENVVRGFELCRADGFPRHWKDWLGKKKKVTNVPPEKDQLTGQVRRFDPIVEEDFFFYLVDWTIGTDEERWVELCSYVKANAPKDFRLLDKIEDMAKPLAPNKTDGVSLEPEEVTVIPIPKEVAEGGAAKEKEPKAAAQTVTLACDEAGCNYEAQGSYAKNSMRFHKAKKHPKVLEKV